MSIFSKYGRCFNGWPNNTNLSCVTKDLRTLNVATHRFLLFFVLCVVGLLSFTSGGEPLFLSIKLCSVCVEGLLV